MGSCVHDETQEAYKRQVAVQNCGHSEAGLVSLEMICDPQILWTACSQLLKPSLLPRQSKSSQLGIGHSALC